MLFGTARALSLKMQYRLAPLVALAMVAIARPAEALTCHIRASQIAVPQVGWEHPANEPLVTFGFWPLAATSLTDSHHRPVDTREVFRTNPYPCGIRYAVWQPKAPLNKGDLYHFQATDSEELPAMLGAVQPVAFVASATAYPTQSIGVAMTLSLNSTDPYHIGSGEDHPGLVGRQVTGHFQLRVTLDTSALLVVELRSEDARFGTVTEAVPTLDVGEAPGTLRRALNQSMLLRRLDQMGPCAEVAVRDYAGRELWRDFACLHLGESQVLHAQVTAPYPPARENPGAIDSIPQSRSCHFGSPAGRRSGGEWWAVGLVSLALWRSTRRRGQNDQRPR